MTSKTSSEPGTARRDRIRFPPRAAVPRDVTILRVPLLGTSWYERGFLYWTRRTGVSAVLALGLVAYLIMIGAVLQVISKPGTTLYNALAAAEVVFTLVSAVLMFRHLWRLGITGRSMRAGSARSGRAGAGIGTLALSTGGVLAGLLVLSSVLTSGIALAIFAIWLTPVLPTEQYARQVLTEELQQASPDQIRRGHGSHTAAPHGQAPGEPARLRRPRRT